MKKMFFLAGLFLLAKMALGQRSVTYEDCYPSMSKLFYRAEVAPCFGKSEHSVENFRLYLDSLFKKNNYKLEGKATVEIVIDNSGTPCCRSIRETEPGNIDFEKIRNAINSMPKWTAGKQNGYDINFMAILFLSGTAGTLTVAFK